MEMESRLALLRKNFSTGAITAAEFRDASSALLIPDSDGRWFQLDPEACEWSKWEAGNWVRLSNRPIDDEEKQPREFRLLISTVLKLTWQYFRRRIPLTILMMVLMSIVYFLLMMGKNEGYKLAYENLGLIEKTLGLGNGPVKTGIYGCLVWMVVVPLAARVLWKIIHKKVKKGLRDVAKIPFTIVRYFREAGPLAVASLTSGAGIGLVLGSLLNVFASLAVAVGMGALILSAARRALAILVRSAWYMTYGMTPGSRLKEFHTETSYVALIGGSLGFAIHTIIPGPFDPVLGVGFLIAAYFLVRREGKKSRVGTLIIIAGLALWSSANRIYPAFAQGSSPPASGINLVEWVKAGGVSPAVVTSVISGILAGIGSGFGSALFKALRDLAPDVNDTIEASRDYKILTGAMAINWLREKGLLNVDDTFNGKFWTEWYEELGEDGELRIIGGDWNPDDRAKPLNAVSVVIATSQGV